MTGEHDEILMSDDENTIVRSVACLDAWLDTMRSADGYSGPVAHWWQQCLLYTGPGLDWRYEGIIAGYLTLWERTGEARWLEKARRAGGDLLRGQTESSHFSASGFEANPSTAGTPHEAACDVGLLQLAKVLKQLGDSCWIEYAAAAERNLRCYYIGQLWDPQTGIFCDDPRKSTFVPNKTATTCEALFELCDLYQDSVWFDRYILTNLNSILAYQVTKCEHLHGAIAQNSVGSRRVEKYFPIYIARCIPALLRGYDWSEDIRYLDAAISALQFLARWMEPDGCFPAVIYSNRRVNRFPNWIAPLGDVLRAAQEIRYFGISLEFSQVRKRLLKYQDSSGGIQTARGFASLVTGKPHQLPEFRDLLHVSGWGDKAFRALAAQVPKGRTLPNIARGEFSSDCIFRGHKLHFRETSIELSLTRDREVVYRWRKSEPWAEIARQEFWLR